MKNKLSILYLISIIAILLSSNSIYAVQSKPSGFYLDLGVGTSLIKKENWDYYASNHDQFHWGYGLTGSVGYKFNPYFGIDAGYDYGKAGSAGKNDCAHLAIKGIGPSSTSNASMFGKIGAALNGKKKCSLYTAVGANWAFTREMGAFLQGSFVTKNDSLSPMILITIGVSLIG